MRDKRKKPRLEPSSASIPSGRHFCFRLLDPEDFAGYKIHWLFNGRRIPGAHKAELGFYHMRPRFNGEYKALLIKGKEILSSNIAKLETLPAESEASITNEESPAAPEPSKPIPLSEALSENRRQQKQSRLKKLLDRAKRESRSAGKKAA